MSYRHGVSLAHVRAGLAADAGRQDMPGGAAGFLRDVEARVFRGWWRRVDVAIVGADPLTAALILAHIARRRASGPFRVAFVSPSGPAPAPLALLEDPRIAREVLSVTPWAHHDAEAPHDLIARIATEVRAMVMEAGLKGYTHDGPVKGAAVDGGARLVMALARPENGARACRPGPVIAQPAGGPGGDILARSRALGVAGCRRLVSGWARTPPNGRRWIDALVCEHVEHVHGVIGDTRHASCVAPSPFAGSVPADGRAALDQWIKGLECVMRRWG